MANKPFVSDIESLAKQSALYPQESPAVIERSQESMLIGIPKEKAQHENRLCLTPESVGVLVANGHQVVIETGAGSAANYSDRDYSEKGARIVYSAKEAFQAEIVLKVHRATIQEVEYMKSGTILISTIREASLGQDYLRALNRRRITALAFELIEDKGGSKPVVRSMSEIAGNSVLPIASEYLSTTRNGRGILLGGVTGVPPLKMVILGAGTVGETVARVARALGAEVKVFDNHHYKLRRLKRELHEQVYTSIIDADVLRKELLEADVVVGALRSQEGRGLCVVSEEMVMDMKEGAVIVDVSINQGGCFETSTPTSLSSPIFVKHGVIHYCVPNVASRVATTATRALSHIFTPILLQMASLGGIEEIMYRKEWFVKGVYAFEGFVTNKNIAEMHRMEYRDLSLLLAARMSCR